MTDQDILDLIKEALADVAPNRTADFATIELSATIESLQLDSIATMEMVGFLEERIETTFPDEELAKVTALADLASLVRAGRVGAA